MSHCVACRGQGYHIVRYLVGLSVAVTVGYMGYLFFFFFVSMLKSCLNCLDLIERGRDEEGERKQMVKS